MMRTHYCGLVTEKLKRPNHHYLRLGASSPWPRWGYFLGYAWPWRPVQVVIDPDTQKHLLPQIAHVLNMCSKSPVVCVSVMPVLKTKTWTSGQLGYLAKDIETNRHFWDAAISLNDEFTNVSWKNCALKYRFLDMRRPEMLRAYEVSCQSHFRPSRRYPRWPRFLDGKPHLDPCHPRRARVIIWYLAACQTVNFMHCLSHPAI